MHKMSSDQGNKTECRSPIFEEDVNHLVVDNIVTAGSYQKELLKYPDEVQAAINEIFPSDDPLDTPDFDPVDYINELFPTEQSLVNLDDVLSDYKCKIGVIDEDMRRIVRGQTNVGEDAAASLEEAQAAIIELFAQMRDIKTKAAESETMVRDITSDIKQLDTAKRNLTSAITTLNHLHMLVGGVSTLQAQTINRQYGDAAMLMQGLLEVLAHFKDYTDIPQIKELSNQVRSIQDQLGEQITEDFKVAFSPENAKTFAPSRQLAEGCLVISTLDGKWKRNLLKFILAHQLSEYAIIFNDAEEVAWLDKIEQRYHWLKRHLVDFQERIGTMFPPDWELDERIAVEFCDTTRKELEKLMFKRKHQLDTKLLLHAIRQTVQFESLLSRKYAGTTIDQYQQDLKQRKIKEAKAESNNPFEEDIQDTSNPFYEDIKKEVTTPTAADKLQIPNLTPFHGLISQCFEAYLYIYIESQDHNLTELINRSAQEQKEKGYNNLSVEGSSVLHSCGDLFMFYKKSIQQCAELSRAEPMLALQKVFKKHLIEYANKILIANMPGKASSNVNSSSAMGQYGLTSLTKELKEVALKDLSNPQGLIQNFFKEGESKITPDERVFLCSVIVTSEYIIETTGKLEEKLKEKVDPDFVSRISFNGEQNIYIGVITSCIQLLVHELEVACDPHLSQMIKMSWANVDSVGDQSPYVSAIVNVAKQMVPVVRDNLESSKKHFTQFCVKFANNFIPKFLQHLYKCRPLSTVGAEQLLLGKRILHKVTVLNIFQLI